MATYGAPGQGYGPVNYAQQGNVSPLGAADNRMRYTDMVRHQAISQYQQSIAQPATLTLGQMRQIATQPQYSYGAPDLQNNMARMYQRQSSLNRMAYSSALAGGALGMGMWEAGAAGAAALGVGGVAGFALPMAAAAVPMHFVNKGIQNNLTRQRFMHGIAADVEQYRDRLGFSSLTYGQATQLGSNLTKSMTRGGQFFSRDQQMRIHKIGLSNDLISARGSGMESGTIKQYEKNFEELKETTKDVVKLLQTTIEGGMSVIKELQQKGFTSMRQIRQQVTQAKAYGTMTGLGSQNMMQIGAAGAQAAQGTPWGAAAMAGQFQAGAAQAHTMAQTGGVRAAAIQRAGGVAAAGAQIAGFTSNVLMSGMGTKMVAYAMNADGSMDDSRMQRLLTGGAGAYEIVSGANQRGYAMGQSGRALFERNKARMLNNMSPEGREMMTAQAFNAWSNQGGRQYASSEAQAWAFAGQFTNNYRERDLMTEYLLAPKNFAQRASERRAVGRGLSQVGRPKREIMPWITRPMKGAAQALEDFGADVSMGFNEAVTTGTQITSGLGRLPGKAWRGAVEGMFGGPYGIYSRGGFGDSVAAERNMSGFAMAQRTTGAARAQYARMSSAQVRGIGAVRAMDTGLDISGIAKNTTGQQMQYLMQSLRTGAGNETLGTVFQDPEVLRALGVGRGTDIHKQILSNPVGAYNDLAQKLNIVHKSANKKADEAMTSWEKDFQNAGADKRNAMRAASINARMLSTKDRTSYMERFESATTDGKKHSAEEEIKYKAVQNEHARQEKQKYRGDSLQSLDVDIAGAKRAADVRASQFILRGRPEGAEDLIVGETKLAGKKITKGGAMWAAQRLFSVVGGEVGRLTMQDVSRQERVFGMYRKLGIETTDPSQMVSQLVSGLESGTIDATDKRTQKRLTKLAKASGYDTREQFIEQAVKANAESGGGELAEVRASRSRVAKELINFSKNNVGKPVSKEVSEEITKFMTGDQRGSLSSGAVSTLHGVTGMTHKRIRELATQDSGEGLVSELLGINKKQGFEAEMYASNRNQLIQNFNKINSALLSGVKESVTIKKGGDDEVELKSVEEMRQAKKDIKDQLEVMSMEKANQPVVQATVQSPVMNYWNNRWSI